MTSLALVPVLQNRFSSVRTAFAGCPGVSLLAALTLKPSTFAEGPAPLASMVSPHVGCNNQAGGCADKYLHCRGTAGPLGWNSCMMRVRCGGVCTTMAPVPCGGTSSLQRGNARQIGCKPVTQDPCGRGRARESSCKPLASRRVKPNAKPPSFRNQTLSAR